MTHQPKGSMCISCGNANASCASRPFASMPVIKTYPDGVKAVKCTGHVHAQASTEKNEALQQGYDAARLEIEALRSRQCLHGISEPSGWMPIETAPKDGTLIVLGARNGVWLGKYLPVYRSGYRPENPWSSMLLNHDHMAERYTRPTHWMPLPPSPSSADEGGSKT